MKNWHRVMKFSHKFVGWMAFSEDISKLVQSKAVANYAN